MARPTDRASALAREGQPQLLRLMVGRITEPLDPDMVERRRVQRLIAQLYASRAPIGDIVTGDPGALPGARPGLDCGPQYLHRGQGYDR